MKNPWLRYLTIRIGLFVAILAVMLFLGFEPFYSAVIAAVISLAISLIFFSKQRAAVSEAIYNFTKSKTDKDTNAEDGNSTNTEDSPKP